MNTTPALKAMAQAICRHLNAKTYQREAPTLDDYVSVARRSYVPAARAGLEAVEPTPDMTRAMHEAVKHQFDLDEAYARIWRAGVDAILKDGP